MATPTLVQHYYTGTMSPPASGLTTVDMSLWLPNKALGGNCLVVFVDYDSGISITSVTDDQGNTWAAASATADVGAGGAKTSVFVRPNCSTDTQKIRIQFGAATGGFHAAILEYANLASSSVVAQTKTSTSPVSPTIAAGAFSSSPTSGNLILQYATPNPGVVGGQACNNVSAWAHGTSFTMLGGDINNIATANPFGMQARLADGGALNATMTATQVTHDTFNTIAVELTAGSSGAVPPVTGIRIKKWQHFIGPGAADTNWTEFYPHDAGSVLVMLTTAPASTTTINTDSESNTWVWDFQDLINTDRPRVQSAQLGAANDAYTMTFKSGTLVNDTWTFIELTGAKATGRLGTSVGTDGLTGASDVNIDHAPDMTPQGNGGSRKSLTIATLPIAHGPITAILSPTPSGALYVGARYPEQTDFDTMVNATGFSVYAPPSSAAFRWNWEWNVSPWTVGSAESWWAVAVEYFEQPEPTMAKANNPVNRPAAFKPGLAR